MATLCVVRERVNALPTAVFALASDFQNAPQRITGIKRMEMLTDGPVGVGTKFRETRVMFGKEATETMEVVDFQPGRSYTLSATGCGMEYRTVVSVRPIGAGSEVSIEFNGTPLTFVARFMCVLMGWMVKSAGVKAMKKDLADLKGAVEGSGAGGTT